MGPTMGTSTSGARDSQWQEGFVATTYALGDGLAAATESLGAEDLAAATHIVNGLASPQRDQRARTLATALGSLAQDIETARLL
jgi:hypothetical protein